MAGFDSTFRLIADRICRERPEWKANDQKAAFLWLLFCFVEVGEVDFYIVFFVSNAVFKRGSFLLTVLPISLRKRKHRMAFLVFAMWYGLDYVDRLKVYTMGRESDFSVRNRFCLKGAMNGMNRNFSPLSIR